MNDNQDQNTPSPDRGSQNKPGKKPSLPRYKRTPFSYLIIIFALLTMMMMIKPWWGVPDRISWNEFIYHVGKNNITTVTVKDVEIVGKFFGGL